MGKNTLSDPREAYRIINECVSIENAAQRFGLAVDCQHHKACCPFHNDHRPSMFFKNNRFKCFACGASGSVLDLVMELSKLDLKSAAVRINEDYKLGLSLEKNPLSPDDDAEILRVRQERANDEALLISFERWEHDSINILCKCHREMWIAKNNLMPTNPDAELNPNYLVACRMIDYTSYIIDVLTFGSTKEKIQLYRERVVDKIVDELRNKTRKTLRTERTGSRGNG